MAGKVLALRRLRAVHGTDPGRTVLEARLPWRRNHDFADGIRIKNVLIGQIYYSHPQDRHAKGWTDDLLE